MRRLCVGLCLWLSWIGVGQAGASGWPGRMVVQLDFPAPLGGRDAMPPSPSKPSWDDATSNHQWRFTLLSLLKRLRFCYFSLRNSHSTLSLFPLRVLPSSISGLANRPRAAAATATESQDGGRGMAVKWRLGAWLRALRRRDFWSRFPRRSAAALCPLPGRRQPGAELLMHELLGASPLRFHRYLKNFYLRVENWLPRCVWMSPVCMWIYLWIVADSSDALSVACIDFCRPVCNCTRAFAFLSVLNCAFGVSCYFCSFVQKEEKLNIWVPSAKFSWVVFSWCSICSMPLNTTQASSCSSGADLERDAPCSKSLQSCYCCTAFWFVTEWDL